MTTQTTLIILKPDAVQRMLCGDILARYERKGLKIVAGKFIKAPVDLAKKHYAEHAAKPFFDSLVKFITSTPVFVLALQGPNAVAVCRTLNGATNAADAAPGSIRGDLGISKSTNLVHASDSPESAKRELALWFAPNELLDWSRDLESWING